MFGAAANNGIVWGGLRNIGLASHIALSVADFRGAPDFLRTVRPRYYSLLNDSACELPSCAVCRTLPRRTCILAHGAPCPSCLRRAASGCFLASC